MVQEIRKQNWLYISVAIMTHSFWSFFDDIVCLNLKHRTDRKEQAAKVFETLKMIENVRFSTIEKDPQGGRRGCFEHHIACLRNGYERGFKAIVTFEDDLSILNMPSVTAMTEILRFMQTNQTWDLLYLGAKPNILFKTYGLVKEFNSIRKVQTRFTHAYIASGRFMHKMHNISYDSFETHIDNLFVLNENAYAIFPTWFVQSESPSDINTMFRFPVFVSRTVGQCNTRYIHTVRLPLIYLLFGICLLLLFCIVFSYMHSARKKRQ